MGRVALIAVLVLAVNASAAQGPPTPWDGVNPFACELQYAGMEPSGPDPGADPYCVEFDKTRQNLTEAGVVYFLSLEPGRVAAAVDKCFYFQSDHWRGSVVQEDGATKTYEWDGHYYFDKAKGEGGVWVTNFNVNGRTQDPSALPGMPAEYAQHFGPGTGGFITHNEIEADPACVAKAEAASPYAAPAAGEAPPSCLAASGGIDATTVGPVRLGATERELWDAFGTPVKVRRGVVRWCVEGGGRLRAGVPRGRSGGSGGPGDGTVRLALTTSPAIALGELATGDPAGAVRDAFPRARRVLVMGPTSVFRLGRGLLAGVRGGTVAYLAAYDPAVIRRAAKLRDWLRRAA